MHTSERITQSDFVYRRQQDSKSEVLSFSEAYPDYHPQDRVGLISPRFEDGLFGLAGAVLGLATGFYDCLRSKGGEFFNYPQHHVFIGGRDVIGVRDARVHTRNGDRDLTNQEMGSAWGWLDVWPETNWHLCPATPAGMLEAAFRHQVNRLFWPASFMPGTVDKPLPHYAYRLLLGRMKSVWYYDCEDGSLEVRASGSAADVIRESLERLPLGARAADPALNPPSRPWFEHSFKPVEPEAFLEDMSACFKDE